MVSWLGQNGSWKWIIPAFGSFFLVAAIFFHALQTALFRAMERSPYHSADGSLPAFCGLASRVSLVFTLLLALLSLMVWL